jgi:hypothetical protein
MPNEKVWNQDANTTDPPDDPDWRLPADQKHFPWALWQRVLREPKAQRFDNVEATLREEIGDMWKPDGHAATADGMERSRRVRDKYGDKQEPAQAGVKRGRS